jgi:hypothetical protein
MNEDQREYDYSQPGPGPDDLCREHRWMIHHLMRLAYEREADFIVESLEAERESISAQLAYIMVYLERRATPEPANG